MSVLGTGYFMKIAKINPSKKKKKSFFIAKISSRKTQKLAKAKSKLPQKFCATRYFPSTFYNGAFDLPYYGIRMYAWN